MTLAERIQESTGEVVHFPKIMREPSSSISLGTAHYDLYDSSREGTESFPQLARLILLKMIEQERERSRGKKSYRYNLTFARERATDRFLEFVGQNSAMSEHLSLEDLSELTQKSPQAISKYFESKEEKSA